MKLANRLLAIVGSSGSGKSTLERYVTSDSRANALVSVTTRAMREGEEHGVTYYFTSPEEFATLDLVESTQYAGNCYGLTKAEIEAKTKECPAVVVVEHDGLRQLRQIDPDIWSVWVDVPEDELVERMKSRGDAPESIEKRRALFETEKTLAKRAGHTFVLPNSKGELARAIYVLTRILEAMKYRT